AARRRPCPRSAAPSPGAIGPARSRCCRARPRADEQHRDVVCQLATVERLRTRDQPFEQRVWLLAPVRPRRNLLGEETLQPRFAEALRILADATLDDAVRVQQDR